MVKAFTVVKNIAMRAGPATIDGIHEGRFAATRSAEQTNESLRGDHQIDIAKQPERLPGFAMVTCLPSP